AQLGVDAASVLVVSDVAAGGAAEKAGVRRYDVLVRVDGKAPATQDRLRKAVASKSPGDSLALDVMRRGRELQLVLRVEGATGDAAASEPVASRDGEAPSLLGANAGGWNAAFGGSGDDRALEDRLARLESRLNRIEEDLRGGLHTAALREPAGSIPPAE